LLDILFLKYNAKVHKIFVITKYSDNFLLCKAKFNILGNKNVAFGNKTRRDESITAAASQNRLMKELKKEVVRKNLYVG